jgi:hypothetical protein
MRHEHRVDGERLEVSNLRRENVRYRVLTQIVLTDRLLKEGV